MEIRSDQYHGATETIDRNQQLLRRLCLSNNAQLIFDGQNFGGASAKNSLGVGKDDLNHREAFFPAAAARARTNLYVSITQATPSGASAFFDFESSPLSTRTTRPSHSMSTS